QRNEKTWPDSRRGGAVPALTRFAGASVRWRLAHRARDEDARSAERSLGQPAGRQTPDAGDRSAPPDQGHQGRPSGGFGSRLDLLKIVCAAERDAGSIDERLIRARSKRIADGDEDAGGDQPRHTRTEPAAQHPDNLRAGADDETETMTVPIGQPAGRHFKQHE